jgi:hypothetical protein
MIIKSARHRIKHTIGHEHEYFKIKISYPKVPWELNVYLSLRAFHCVWSFGDENERSLMIRGGSHRLLQSLSSCHMLSRLIYVGSPLFICGLTQLLSVFMGLLVCAQSVYAIGCCPLCVILRGLLQTSPCIGCRQHVSSFANAPGVFVLFQASEFLHVWCSGSIAQTSLRCCHPHLHSLVLIVLLLPLPHRFSPIYITELIPKYDSIKKL